MYKINKTHILCLLFFIYLILPIASLKAQNGLKELLEKMLEATLEKTNVHQKEPRYKIVENLEADSIGIVKKDTTSQLKDKQFLDTAIAFDTIEFTSRNQTVKNRRPMVIANNEEGWQRSLLLTHTNVYKREHKLDSTKSVFGWHPYWMGTAYYSYNFSLLSAVAYTSYEVNPTTGYYTSIHDWRTTKLVDSAHAHQCKVLLSVTNFGSKNNTQFLSNLNAQQTFINTLITLLRERNADGVNIDFEDIPRSAKINLTNFIIDLSSSMHAAKKEYLITIALPAIDFEYVYDVKQLNKFVDLFIIMGYEFYGQNSPIAGPIAPLSSGKTWWPYNLEKAVDEYIVSGVVPSKLLLGLPYYGAEWQTKDLKFPSKVEKFIGYPMYRTIKKEHGDLVCCEEDDSKSRFHVYRDDNNHYRQVWYEDEKSLAKKYDWVIAKKIGGIGIWALGYDNGYTELWKLLAEKFTIKPKPIVPKKKALIASEVNISFKHFFSIVLRIITNPKALLSRPGPIVGIFFGLFGVSLSSIYLLIRYGHRIKRFYKIIIQGGIALVVLVVFALLFVIMKLTGIKEIVFLLSGFLMSGILFMIFTRQFLVEKDLP